MSEPGSKPNHANCLHMVEWTPPAFPGPAVESSFTQTELPSAQPHSAVPNGVDPTSFVSPDAEYFQSADKAAGAGPAAGCYLLTSLVSWAAYCQPADEAAGGPACSCFVVSLGCFPKGVNAFPPLDGEPAVSSQACGELRAVHLWLPPPAQPFPFSLPAPHLQASART